MKHIPQIIYFALVFIGLLVAANRHGKPKGDYNFWVEVMGYLIMGGLFYWGGFFDVFFK